MTKYIRANAELSIPEGKIDEFKKLAAEVIKKVEANEPNTLSLDSAPYELNSETKSNRVYQEKGTRLNQEEKGGRNSLTWAVRSRSHWPTGALRPGFPRLSA